MKHFLRVFFATSCLMLRGVRPGAIGSEATQHSPSAQLHKCAEMRSRSDRRYRGHQEYLNMENF